MIKLGIIAAVVVAVLTVALIVVALVFAEYLLIIVVGLLGAAVILYIYRDRIMGG
jgi:hypothetical protein